MILWRKPIRSTWDPTAGNYAEEGKASGLDTVFNSRLPKPFRIGSLEDPEEEHKKLLKLVLEPVINKLKALMIDEQSVLRKKVAELQGEAEKPVADFRKEIARVESQVNSSYRRVFSAAEIKLNVSLGQLDFDPEKSLVSASRIDVAEPHGQTRWNQQGTGSQRALFWSMLEVRSELNRIAEERKQLEKAIRDKEKELATQTKKLPSLKTEAAKQKCLAEIDRIGNELKDLRANNGGTSVEQETFLPGYMLLIDEPETALHPAAVRAAKEHLYSLAETAMLLKMIAQAEPHILANPAFWISLASLLLAFLAGYNSWRSRQIAACALSISENQEQRREPHLEIYLANGYRRYLPNRQLFGFLVSVSNTSDINNSIAKAELQVTYVITGEIKATCRIPHNPELIETVDDPGNRKANIFSIPARIDSHQTLNGWLFFTLDNGLIGGRTIDAHRILLEDSHGVSAETEPISVKEWANENTKA